MAESLEKLAHGFEVWRSEKRYMREPVPDELLERARQASAIYGLGKVARRVKIAPSRIRGERQRRARPATAPTFSRFELTAPATTIRAFAEVETQAGVKLRFFDQTEETLRLLSSLCGLGGGR